MMRYRSTCLVLPLLFGMTGLFVSPGLAWAGPPYQATGFKVGEVDHQSAIVWTRLTEAPVRVGPAGGIPTVLYRDAETGELGRNSARGTREPVVFYPNGHRVAQLEGACPGMPGEVRVGYRPYDAAQWAWTAWTAVDPERDYTHQFALEALRPNTSYEIQVAARTTGGAPGQVRHGRFHTAPAPAEAAPVTFVVTTCHRYDRRDHRDQGWPVYYAMLAQDPHFFVHTGDIVYYDYLAKTPALARWHWQRTYSFPTNVDFHAQVASYFIKDDHDTWDNDAWPGKVMPYMGDFTFEQGMAIFREQVPMRERTYRTVRWGRDLQIWMVEGRDYRSANTMPPSPDKTVWGAEQMAWFKETVAASDATFRVLISPTPVVGPDRIRKADNHSNLAFRDEGEALRRFISEQEDMFVVNGDRHWQYVSVDEETGVREFSVGPGANKHAGGWSNDQRMPEHQYLNVTGGFFSARVQRIDGVPTLITRHHDVDGAIYHEERHPATAK